MTNVRIAQEKLMTPACTPSKFYRMRHGFSFLCYFLACGLTHINCLVFNPFTQPPLHFLIQNKFPASLMLTSLARGVRLFLLILMVILVNLLILISVVVLLRLVEISLRTRSWHKIEQIYFIPFGYFGQFTKIFIRFSMNNIRLRIIFDVAAI